MAEGNVRFNTDMLGTLQSTVFVLLPVTFAVPVTSWNKQLVKEIQIPLEFGAAVEIFQCIICLVGSKNTPASISITKYLSPGNTLY